jgi:lipoprotein-anchoring transpeptidase ErfK/SrfK
MNVDYYAILAKAVAGKDEAARNRIYGEASNLIRRSSHLTPDAVVTHAAALKDAIQRIEDEVAADGVESEADARAALLPTDRSWRPALVVASAVVAVIALSVLLFGYVTSKVPIGAGMTASSSKAARGQDDAVMADLKPGVDGGSSGNVLPFAFQRQVIFYRTTVAPGSIVIDRDNRFLYLIDSNNSARRYGIGIADGCLKGGNLFRVAGKLEWPDWKTYSANMKDAGGLVASTGRPGSLLGARALVLDKPGLLIHGTNSPKTIGHLVASGCIRLVNDDVEDLYRRVSLETRVVFVS